MKLDFHKCKKETKPDFLKKNMCIQNIRVFLSKIGVFGHFLKIAILDFANFASFIRQERYIADLGGFNHQKNISVIHSLLMLVSKLSFYLPIHIFLTFTHKLFFVLHIMIDNNVF